MELGINGRVIPWYTGWQSYKMYVKHLTCLYPLNVCIVFKNCFCSCSKIHFCHSLLANMTWLPTVSVLVVGLSSRTTKYTPSEDNWSRYGTDCLLNVFSLSIFYFLISSIVCRRVLIWCCLTRCLRFCTHLKNPQFTQAKLYHMFFLYINMVIIFIILLKF